MGSFLPIGYPLLFYEKIFQKVLRKPSSDPFDDLGDLKPPSEHKTNGSRIFADLIVGIKVVLRTNMPSSEELGD
jgi:hypothetical protein